MPIVVQTAVNIYHSLGDRVVADIGFIGKDYTSLPLYFELYKIDDKEYYLELLLWMERYYIKKSSDNMKKQMDKIKNKGKPPSAVARGKRR